MVSVVGFLMVSGCYRTAAVSPMGTVKKTPGRFRDELSTYIYIYIHICSLGVRHAALAAEDHGRVPALAALVPDEGRLLIRSYSII